MIDPKITKILKAFEVFDGVYKRDEVDSAVELQEEITPHLIKVLEQVLSDPAAYADTQNYYAHVYALILLGHFKETRAHRVIAELFSLPDDLPSQLFGDLVTEDLSIILYRTCDGSMDLIRSLILNKNADDYCRSSAMRAMVFGVVEGIFPREEAMSLFGSLFKGTEAGSDSSFWSLLANNVCDMYPEGMMEVIEKAYCDGLIYPGFVGIEDFERTLAAGKEHAFEEIRTEIRDRSPENVHDCMSWWACFRPEEPSSVFSTSPSRQPVHKSKSKEKAEKRKKRKRQRASMKKGHRRTGRRK